MKREFSWFLASTVVFAIIGGVLEDYYHFKGPITFMITTIVGAIVGLVIACYSSSPDLDKPYEPLHFCGACWPQKKCGYQHMLLFRVDLWNSKTSTTVGARAHVEIHASSGGEAIRRARQKGYEDAEVWVLEDVQALEYKRF